MPKTTAAVKRLLLGWPRASRSADAHEQRLPMRLALPVYAASPLSSVAYATQEIMVVLAVAGAAALRLTPVIAVTVVALLAIVITSYRQTVRAYPQGGGAYAVARPNLGVGAGLAAAGALLAGYVLTVAVAVAAAAAALSSAVPAWADRGLVISLVLVALVTIANLRGVPESGPWFSLPVYGFVLAAAGVVGAGLIRCAVDACPQAPIDPVAATEPLAAVTLLLVLRAFAFGTVALTGIEAVSNGVPSFRYPQSRNAARTLGAVGVLVAPLLVGLSYLAVQASATVGGGAHRTVLAQVTIAALGEGVVFLAVQGVTAAILVLAAHTAYTDFPRLAAVLARDRFLPRQLAAPGERLVFSNGIVMLALAAALLLVVMGASVTRLVPLYVAGVFVAFTLSQAGMVRHWQRARTPGWRWSTTVNAFGAAVTGGVVVVVSVTTWRAGTWAVLLAIPAAAAVMWRIHRHYDRVSLLLRTEVASPEATRPNHIVILIDRVDEAAARAVSYSLTTAAASVQALAVPMPGADVPRRWRELAPDIPLTILEPASQRGTPAAIRAALGEARRANPGDFTTALVAETLSRGWLDQLRRHRLALRIKTGLLREGEAIVADITSPEGGPGPYTLEEPRQHHVVVLTAAVNKATTRALAYAEGLQPTSVRALSVNVGLRPTTSLLEEWEDWGLSTPLELLDSPYRSITETVRAYVRDFSPDGREVVVTCVLPEFVLPRWRHQPLHNQTALLLKSALLFERGVVTVSLPYRLPLD